MFTNQENTISNLNPGADDLWFLPLGGTGEIGMNLNLYGHQGKWLMVDCGVSFNEPLVPTTKAPDSALADTFAVVAPDPTFIAENKDALAGLVITHGHEDHVGAVPYLWKRFRCPVYTTPFTAELLRRKLARENLGGQIPIIEVSGESTHTIGPFVVSWLAITHSIPEPYAVKIATQRAPDCIPPTGKLMLILLAGKRLSTVCINRLPRKIFLPWWAIQPMH